MGISQKIIEWCSWLIGTFGYPGIFILMFFESMYVPVPSEAVMPFVGFVAFEVATGARTSGPDFWLGCLVAALGGLGGSLTTYYFGRWAGPVGVRKWGRYAGLVEHDLDVTQAFFDRRGAVTVFIARFVPVVRHFISTVAGIARMRVVPFVLMTTGGAFLWDLFLAWLGWHWGKKAQELVHRYNEPADVVVVLLGVVGLVVVFRHLKGRSHAPAPAVPAEPPLAVGPDMGAVAARPTEPARAAGESADRGTSSGNGS